MSRLGKPKTTGTDTHKPHRGPICEYTIYVLCLEAPAAHPDWAGKQWVRLDPTPWGIVGHNTGNHAWCVNAAGWIAKQVQECEGGQWRGVVRSCAHDQAPERSLTADEVQGTIQHILDGPDGPGRRFVLRRQACQPDVSHECIAPVLPLWSQPVDGAGPEDAF